MEYLLRILTYAIRTAIDTCKHLEQIEYAYIFYPDLFIPTYKNQINVNIYTYFCIIHHNI